MKRHATLLLATLLLGIGACDKPAEPAQAKAEADKPAQQPAEEAKPTAQPETAPEAAQPEAATVASGLALGQRFAAFEIINCDSGDQYCQVCKYGPSPKIMAVG